MSALVKTVKCIKCHSEMKIKSFCINPGKYVIGKGYLCNECVKKSKAAQKGAPQKKKGGK